MRRDKPEISGNDVADESADARHEAREAVVRRACEMMGWPYSTSPAYTGIRQVALGNAVAVSVEKLTLLLDQLATVTAERDAAQRELALALARAAALEAERDEANDLKTEYYRQCEYALARLQSEKEIAHAEWGKRVNTEARLAALEALAGEMAALLGKIASRWTFNNYQRHTHNWHDWADCVPQIKATVARLAALKAESPP